jgi:hypothetical protein
MSYDIVVDRATETGIEKEVVQEKIAGHAVEKVADEYREESDVLGVNIQKSY